MQMDQENRPYISWELVGNFMIDAFKAAGLPEEDAKICADVLMESDRRGIESHGVNRFKPIYLDRINAGILKTTTEYEILKETPTTLVADAHDGMGMVASYHVMNMLLEKAEKYEEEEHKENKRSSARKKNRSKSSWKTGSEAGIESGSEEVNEHEEEKENKPAPSSGNVIPSDVLGMFGGDDEDD